VGNLAQGEGNRLFFSIAASGRTAKPAEVLSALLEIPGEHAERIMVKKTKTVWTQGETSRVRLKGKCPVE
jgi:hypothetical protein